MLRAVALMSVGGRFWARGRTHKVPRSRGKDRFSEHAHDRIYTPFALSRDVSFSELRRIVTIVEPPAMSSSTPRDNPYLAHLPPAMRGTSSHASSSAKAKEPLYGFIPRKVKAPQVLAAMVRCSLLSRHYSPASNILHANI
jgi:hypothetical protein